MKKKASKPKRKDADERYKTEAGLKEDNATNMEGIRSSTMATPDDGTSQGRRRQRSSNLKRS